MASDNGSILSNLAPRSMGRSLPNKQNVENFSAAHLLTLGSPEFNEHIYELGLSTQVDAMKLKVPGWTDVSEADECRLLQRISKWVDTLSHPINLEQVNDRLLGFQASGLPVTRSPLASWTTTPDAEEEDRLLIVQETVENHEDHHDMLRTWGLENGVDVYRTQFIGWEKFRRWQADNRGIFDIETDLRKKQAHDALRNKSLGRGPPCHDPEWERKRLTDERTREHRDCVELGVAKMEGENRFPVYVQAAQARLKRHGFTREFQPAQDHLHQDQLTTWIEYLNYEYWVQDGLADKASRCQSKYEQTLKALLDAKILLQGETPESVIEFHNLFQLQNKKYLAETAVKEAESNIEARQEVLGNTNNNTYALTKAVSLAQLQKSLKKAVEFLTPVETRFRLITDFSNAGRLCKRAKERAEKHHLLLQWTLDQVPLVEAEMTEGGYVTTPGGTRKTRPDHKGNLDGPDPQRIESHTPTPQEVVPPAGPPGQTHSSPSPKRPQSDVDEGDGEGPEGATAKRLKLDAQVVRGTQSAPEPQEQAPSSTPSSPLSWLSSTPILKPSSALSSLKRTRSDNDREEELEAPTAKRLKPNAQAVRGRGTRARQAPEGERAEGRLNQKELGPK